MLANATPNRAPVTCCNVISETTTFAWPEVMAAAASPTLPAAPPPPPVSVPVNLTSGIPSVCAINAVSEPPE